MSGQRLSTAFLITCLVVFAPLSQANPDSAPVGLSFYQQRPGILIDVAGLRMHLDCRGAGDTTVLFEAGLGGNALEWESVRRLLGDSVRHCSYDRGGYGWSDPVGLPRTAQQLAREARLLLHKARIDGPVILVGHSFGGFIVRLLARKPGVDAIGLVLVDASHERQLEQLETDGHRRVMPRGGHFVMGGLGIPDNLPEDVQPIVEGLARMRKTYAAVHGEMREFRRSVRQISALSEPMNLPVTVLYRGRRVFENRGEDGQRDDVWEALQQDLATISTRGQARRADGSGHHIHLDEPHLVVEAIEEILDGR